MEWGKLSVWLLGICFIWFGHSGDAWSCLVTREMLYLVRLLGRCLIWFGHSGDAWSDLTPSGGVRGCVMTIFKTLSCFNYSGDVVWFEPLGRRGVPVTSLGRRNQTLTWLSQKKTSYLPTLFSCNPYFSQRSGVTIEACLAVHNDWWVVSNYNQK